MNRGCGSGPSSPPSSLDEAILDADGTLVGDRRRVQARRGHRLRRPVGLPSAAWSRWPTPPSRCSWSIAAATAPRTSGPACTWTRRSRCAVGPASARSSCGATRGSPRTRTWILGRSGPAAGRHDFAETAHLDCWDDAGNIRFIFGYAAYDVLKARADALPDEAYSFLERPPRYAIKTAPRQQPERVKPEIVRERGFKTIHLLEEMIAEFDYRPVACKKSYRVVVLRKRLGIDKGQMRLFEEYRYFFYITNDRDLTAEEVVFSANDRCDQENLIAQLKGGVHALTTPVDDLVSNWAYMVMASLAWSLKAWSAPAGAGIAAARGEAPGGEANAVADGVRDVLRGGDPDAVPDRAGWTRLIYRLLSWNPWQGVFLRLVERLHGCWLC